MNNIVNIQDKPPLESLTVRYASFGMRAASFIIDNVIFSIAINILTYILGDGKFELLVSSFFMFCIFFICNLKKQATPAKLMLSIKLADASTFQKPADKNIISRYVLSSGFFSLYSLYSIFFGQSKIIWLSLILYTSIVCLYALFNDKVQTWYDKQTKIVVIHD